MNQLLMVAWGGGFRDGSTPVRVKRVVPPHAAARIEFLRMQWV
jgi:hypothetical protein